MRNHGPSWIVSIGVTYEGQECYLSERAYARGQGGPVYYRGANGRLQRVPKRYNDKALDKSFTGIELTAELERQGGSDGTKRTTPPRI